MKIKIELHLPDIFFDSARENNNFESLSEQISKAVLVDILNVENIRRGDDKKQEPDYISGQTGYEVTLGINDSLIPMLKGRASFDKSLHNQEQELIDSIMRALERKSKKKYSIRTNLIIFTLTPLFEWYSYFYLRGSSTYNYWCLLQANRNKLFEKIIEKYIGDQNPFEDVLIIQPTHDERYILYSAKSYAKDETFMTQIGIKTGEELLFPRYKLIACEEGPFPIVYEISELMYKRGE